MNRKLKSGPARYTGPKKPPKREPITLEGAKYIPGGVDLGENTGWKINGISLSRKVHLILQ